MAVLGRYRSTALTPAACHYISLLPKGRSVSRRRKSCRSQTENEGQRTWLLCTSEKAVEDHCDAEDEQTQQLVKVRLAGNFVELASSRWDPRRVDLSRLRPLDEHLNPFLGSVRNPNSAHSYASGPLVRLLRVMHRMARCGKAKIPFAAEVVPHKEVLLD